ncbi:MAG: hypothetical protein KDA91_18990 [Planctomycetaceae bacterium]|nr:hypothetical protein [Planctomycetaceae bacterium]
MNSLFRIAVLSCLACSVGCSGDDSGPPTVSVSGMITLDGTPVPEGEIIFRSADGGGGRADAAQIKDGKFSMESTLGNKKVEIRALRPVAGASTTTLETGEVGGEVEQYIPEQYNDKSTLNAEVSESGEKDFKFELTSQ